MASYKAIVDNINQEEWEHYASNFADYNIYQTWPYQQVRGEMDGQKVSRVVIKDENGNATAMCQVRIKHIKLLGLRVGYVQWGPLVRRKNGTMKCTVEVLKELRNAYLGTRVNVLRIVPSVCDNERGQEFAKILQSSGFQYVQSVAPHHTMLLLLNCSEEILRKRLHQSWRRKLKKAENAGIKITEDTDEVSFAILEKLYLETVRRKGFKGLDPQQFVRAQSILSDAEKMRIIVAYYNGEPITAHVTTNLGDTAILLMVASNEKGLEFGASYLVWWKAIVASMRRGMKKYDVGGIDYKKNPHVSRFKAGIGGEECSHIGAFEACNSLVVRNIWRVTEKTYRFIKK